MNCRRAQSDIALWAGNDLDEAGLADLQVHLEACPECRKYLTQMQALLQLVDNCPLRDEADEASQAAVEDSLWPSLSTKLVSLPASRYDRFNGWIPAVAVAAVCFAMVLVASPPQSAPPQSTPAGSVTADEDQPELEKPFDNPRSNRILPSGRFNGLSIEELPVDQHQHVPQRRSPAFSEPAPFFGPNLNGFPEEVQEKIRQRLYEFDRFNQRFFPFENMRDDFSRGPENQTPRTQTVFDAGLKVTSVAAASSRRAFFRRLKPRNR